MRWVSLHIMAAMRQYGGALLGLMLAIMGTSSDSKADVHVREDFLNSTATLNQFTFKGNVLDGRSELAEHWIVFFRAGTSRVRDCYLVSGPSQGSFQGS
mmetsp:Transcript_47528/g.151633  ORF Transcript_47528/g.151633 Transcript_47528/m.151633 type:complete len:99 (+) Transcript_47528:59-355(+)